MMKKNNPVSAKDLYLSIAFLKECNIGCGYCHPFGESKITHGENMSESEIRQVIDASHETGLRVYRFTGGECTFLPWFADSLEYALGKSPDTRVNVCTNGSTLMKYEGLFNKHKDRVSLRVSLDSLDKEKRRDGLAKVLNPLLKSNLEKLSEDRVYTRFNMVVTQKNVDEVFPMIDFAAGLGFDLKLLDMYVQDKYIATNGRSGLLELGDPKKYWEDNFVDLTTLVPELTEKADKAIPSYNRDGGLGIPMYAFDMQGIKVILKDSTKGAFFSESKCIGACPLFGKSCQEGVYTPHVSSNMILHINGCHNEGYQKNLRNQPHKEQVRRFEEVLEYFQDLKHIPKPPKTIQNYQEMHLI